MHRVRRLQRNRGVLPRFSVLLAVLHVARQNALHWCKGPLLPGEGLIDVTHRLWIKACIEARQERYEKFGVEPLDSKVIADLMREVF